MKLSEQPGLHNPQDSLDSIEKNGRKELRMKRNMMQEDKLKHSSGDLARDSTSLTRRSLSEYIGLTPYQQKQLMQCWPNIYSTGLNGQFATSIYSNLTNKSAKARQLLAKVVYALLIYIDINLLVTEVIEKLKSSNS
uniref:Uncharacterized protein n=1 Tax=Heterorhabditis bacteriophora TaxID=37862 RepID=A0A1I7X3C5_HETBA